MRSTELETLLSEAYRIDQLAGNHLDAVRVLRAAVTAESAGQLRAEALEECGRLGRIVEARSIGGQHGCHITAVTHRLLRDALLAEDAVSSVDRATGA